MAKFQFLAVGITAFSLFYSGCDPSDFNYGKVGKIIQNAPFKLDAEYVTLTGGQVDCGVQEDLWDPPVPSGHGSVAHLTQKGRDLKFSDDVSIGEMRFPYVQIRGDFNLFVNEITSDRDGPQPNTKLVETKVAAVIQDACFPNPLPIMGVRKGNFTQDYSPVLLFRYNNGWQLDGFQH